MNSLVLKKKSLCNSNFNLSSEMHHVMFNYFFNLFIDIFFRIIKIDTVKLSFKEYFQNVTQASMVKTVQRSAALTVSLAVRVTGLQVNALQAVNKDGQEAIVTNLRILYFFSKLI